MSIYDSTGIVATKPKGSIYDTLPTSTPVATHSTAYNVGSTISSVGSATAKFAMPQVPDYAPTLQGQVDAINNPPKQSLFDKVLAPTRAVVGGIVSGIQNTPIVPKTTDLVAGVGGGNDIYKALSGAIQQGSDNLLKQFNTMSNEFSKDNPSPLKIGAAAGQVFTGSMIKPIFGAFMSPFQAYASVPVLGNILDGFNMFFGALGGGGGAGLEESVQQIPYITQETKDTIKPLANDIGALAAQIIGGKVLDMGTEAGKAKFAKLTDNSRAIMTELANDPALQQAIIDHVRPAIKVPVTDFTGEIPVKINTPATKQADYAKSQGYEPITPAEQLPVIPFGAKAKSSEPVIQIGVPTRKVSGDITYEPVKSPIQVEPTSPTETKLQVSETPAQKPITIAPIETPKVPERPVINGERVTKAASDINTGLVERGFSEMPPEQQATYTPSTKAEQIQRVGDLMTADIAKAKDMATGKEPVPNGVHPQVLFNAIESHATATGDVGLLRALAKSPIATQLSEAGQTLGSHGFNDNPNSAVKAIRDVTKARTSSIESKGIDITKETAKTAKEIKTEVKNAVSARPAWEDFIKSIQCGY